MKKVTDGGANWLGDLASALMPPKDPSTDGDCLGLNAIGLVGVSCDAVSNFVCQAPEPGGNTKLATRCFPAKLLCSLPLEITNK